MTAGKSPLEIFLAEIAEIRAKGAGTKETSYYPALEKLLTEGSRTPNQPASRAIRTPLKPCA